MNTSYCILINTCDKFEDCWDPFFKLFKIYWPNFQGKIYLNTEYKDYSYENLDIICVKGCLRNNYPKNKRATWSQCLAWALELIEEDIILYMQEDYFIKAPVKNNYINEFIQLINTTKTIHCIHLTDQGSPAENKSEYNHLYRVPKFHRDRISCQAALWQKKILKQYIRNFESAWNFEWWGSKRASVYDHNFYTVDRNWVILNKFEIIPYVFTGVIGGKWKKEIVELFEKNNILIDYTKRGFFKQQNKSIKDRLKAKLRRIPTEIKSKKDLIQLKYKYNN